MILPVIHINGTGRESLAQRVLAAREALRNALDALNEAAPNGRDYYPLGECAFRQAAREHHARIGKLVSVADELEELHLHILGAGLD